MSSDDGSLWITFNGQIFSYGQLRSDCGRGYPFGRGPTPGS